MDAANLLRQQQQMNSGLMRYRSAPSSLIATLMEDDDDGDTEGCDDFIPSSHHHHHHQHRSSSPEAESMFARFMNCGGAAAAADLASPDLGDKFPHFINTTIEQKFNPPPPMMYQTPPPEEDPYNSNSNSNSNSVPPQVKMSTATTPSPSSASNLIRHSSSPAGLFSHLSVQNGYGVMRGIGNPRVGNGTNGGEVIGGRLKNQINLSSATPSSSGLMSQISEIESNEDGASLGNGNTSSNRYIPNFPIASWDDSALENFSGLKRPRDVVNNNNNNNKKMIPSSSETQNGNRAPSLTHHYSLPKNSAEMAAILQFQDSVPCKIRAKRGCATHPRSIAERVRRTRISERMRKLQELVPNMDKQTNTADMLDLAVEYIKDLQKQVKTLNDVRANCTCSGKQKPY